jgi:hypothetical protein
VAAAAPARAGLLRPVAGGSAELPDIKTTVSASKTTGLRLGERVIVTVTLVNTGSAAASDVHVLITPSLNTITRGQPTASRGPGCTGLAAIDCNLGSLPSGATATVRLLLSAVSGQKLFVFATTQENQRDQNVRDNVGTLTLKVLPRQTRFTVSAVKGRIVAGEQLASIKLSARARVTAQVYLRGVPRPIGWRRMLAAGTSIVRIPVPGIGHGQRFTLVVRAQSGSRKATTTLKLVG